jgi:hypothetical protein
MKKVLFTMIALLSMTAGMAQQSDNGNGERRGPRQMTPEDMTTRMTQQLNLTEDQQTKVLALNKEFQDMFQVPRGFRGEQRGQRGQQPDAQGGAPQQRPQLTEEQREQMKQMMEKRQAYDKKLKEILTDEQYKTYQQSRQRRGGFGGPRGPRGQRPQGN